MDETVKIETKSQRVRLRTTDGTTFRGKINLNNEFEQMDRMSDFFLKGKNPFLILYDVTAQGASTFFVINKSHIIWVTPDD
jgi:hypothetical protein